MSGTVAGLDGCPNGWALVLVELGSGRALLRRITHFSELTRAPDLPQVLAIDMPIGLPERVGRGGRGPEQVVRPLLGGRQSSVFSIPSRAAVYATDYARACALALATSDPPRKVARQTFNLFPKIREVDTALRDDEALRTRTYESHPEVAFWFMNGEQPLEEPKKVRGRPYEPGLQLRRNLLQREGFSRDFLETPPPRGVGADDMLDACACAVTARWIALDLARSFPSPPQRDGFGLPIAIWA